MVGLPFLLQYGERIRKGKSECWGTTHVSGRGLVEANRTCSWVVAVEDERSRKNSETTWELELMEPGE